MDVTMNSGNTTPSVAPSSYDGDADPKPARKIDFTYNDSETDLELVSSDGITFLIFTYHLQSASPIFRQTLLLPLGPPPPATVPGPPPNATDPGSSSTRARIDLSDPSYETAHVIRHFLQLLDGSWFPPPASLPDFDLIASLLALADKWECRLISSALTRSLLGFATHNASHKCAVWRSFALAAKRGETWAAAAILRNVSGPAGKWATTHPKVTAGQAKVGYWILDPAGMAPGQVEAIPPIYLWALGRVFEDWRVKVAGWKEAWSRDAWGKKIHGPMCKGCDCKRIDLDDDGNDGTEDEVYEVPHPDWTAMADEFTKLINRYKGNGKLGGCGSVYGN